MIKGPGVIQGPGAAALASRDPKTYEGAVATPEMFAEWARILGEANPKEFISWSTDYLAEHVVDLDEPISWDAWCQWVAHLFELQAAGQLGTQR